MILQLINIFCGILLISVLIKKYFPNQQVENFFHKMEPYEVTLGVVALVLGLLGLIERLDLIYFGLRLGSSFPQTLPAIAAGLVLAAPLVLKRFPALQNTVHTLTTQSLAIGVVCIASGLGSILFGCVFPLVCRVPF